MIKKGKKKLLTMILSALLCLSLTGSNVLCVLADSVTQPAGSAAGTETASQTDSETKTASQNVTDNESGESVPAMNTEKTQEENLPAGSGEAAVDHSAASSETPA